MDFSCVNYMYIFLQREFLHFHILNVIYRSFDTQLLHLMSERGCWDIAATWKSSGDTN